jgi:predicted nucleic acid-binding protein
MEAVRSLRDLNITSMDSAPLLKEALPIALDFNRTVYDAIYVALAVRSRRSLITADERLVNALGARFPVLWLGRFY